MGWVFRQLMARAWVALLRRSRSSAALLGARVDEGLILRVEEREPAALFEAATEHLVKRVEVPGGQQVLGFVDDDGIEEPFAGVGCGDLGVLGKELVEGGVVGGVELGFELRCERRGFDDLVEVTMDVSDDQLTGVVFGVGTDCDARGEELVVREEQDTLPLARQAPGGLDGQ